VNPVRRFAIYRIGEPERTLEVIAHNCDEAEQIAARVLGCSSAKLLAYARNGVRLDGPGATEGMRYVRRARELGIQPRDAGRRVRPRTSAGSS